MKNKLILLLSFVVVFFGCKDDPTPKPKGYFRIALEEKSYENYFARCNHTFEKPKNAIIIQHSGTKFDSCFYNLSYPNLSAKIHFSYLKIDNNLQNYITDAYNMVYKHEIKASSIETIPYSDTQRNISGLIYELGGDVASSLQFYMTDSTNHFVRGSLYFFNKPNADSIAPVLDYIKEDVLHMYETIEWR